MINVVLFHRMKAKEGVSSQLQKLFRSLESIKGSVSTKGFTQALGIRNGKLIIMCTL